MIAFDMPMALVVLLVVGLVVYAIRTIFEVATFVEYARAQRDEREIRRMTADDEGMRTGNPESEVPLPLAVIVVVAAVGLALTIFGELG